MDSSLVHMLLGTGLIVGTGVAYVASLLWRRRELVRQLRVLREVEGEPMV